MADMDVRLMTLEQLEALMSQLGEKPFRGRQIFEWVHKKSADSFDDMTNLSKALREKLKQHADFAPVTLLKTVRSEDGGAVKYLFKLAHDTVIESVLMKYSYGNTACISSQAGCRMGCTFCASSLVKWERNLNAGEMAAQVYNIQRESGERVGNIVIMGVGEPFDNYDNTMAFLRLMNSPDGLGIGQRSMTVSTCGDADAIYDFADENTQVNLAVSLHAPNDDIRKQIMPIAKRYNMQQLFEACKYYCDTTRRRITYEYALIAGLNDSVAHAKELGAKLRRTLSHVNLISLNNIAGKSFPASDTKTKEDFAMTLRACGIETTIRRKMGTDIDAACGQLRVKHI